MSRLLALNNKLPIPLFLCVRLLTGFGSGGLCQARSQGKFRISDWLRLHAFARPGWHPVFTLPVLLFSVRYTCLKVVAEIPYGLRRLLANKFRILDARPVFLPLSVYVPLLSSHYFLFTFNNKFPIPPIL